MTPLRIVALQIKIKEKINEIGRVKEESCSFHPASYHLGYEQVLKDILEEL